MRYMETNFQLGTALMTSMIHFLLARNSIALYIRVEAVIVITILSRIIDFLNHYSAYVQALKFIIIVASIFDYD